MNIVLSIVIPCFNAHDRSRRLFETLKLLNRDDIEVVVADDGSSLEERRLLLSDAESLLCNYKFAFQRNAGPGAARNLGLDNASGLYVWFVDSDDDIAISAIDEVCNLYHEGYDFIDFKVSKKGLAESSMNAVSGEFKTSEMPNKPLSGMFGRLWSKAFRKEFLISNGIRYPEKCFYEDNYLGLTIPLFVGTFYCSDTVGYFHNVDGSSITRTKTKTLDVKYFDRLITAYEGAKAAIKVDKDPASRAININRFKSIFLLTTASKLNSNECPDDMLIRLFSAYKHCISSLVPSVMVDKEIEKAGKQVASRLDGTERAIDWKEAWDSAPPSPSALEWFKKHRDDVWNGSAVFPSLGRRA